MLMQNLRKNKLFGYFLALLMALTPTMAFGDSHDIADFPQKITEFANSLQTLARQFEDKGYTFVDKNGDPISYDNMIKSDPERIRALTPEDGTRQWGLEIVRSQIESGSSLVISLAIYNKLFTERLSSRAFEIPMTNGDVEGYKVMFDQTMKGLLQDVEQSTITITLDATSPLGSLNISIQRIILTLTILSSISMFLSCVKQLTTKGHAASPLSAYLLLAGVVGYTSALAILGWSDNKKN